LKRTDGVVIYLEPRQAGNGLYRQALTLAATLGLAVIFFVLPDSRRGKAKLRTKVITVAHKCSVPAMTVEASDAIALYRVVQESLGRFRAGGGPVLIEGVTFPASAGDVPLNDPVEQLGRYLLNRRLCTEDWVAATKRSFRKRLATAKRS
jgi:TPP-dependent pyruvate/acetoin dehydrogenase alpha subunit